MITSAGSVCIVDDYNPRWSDPRHDPEPTAFGVGEEVYHFLMLDHSEEEFNTAVRISNQIWHGVAAVCRETIGLDSKRETTISELKLCAASAQLITCTAYDGEGFVAWRRSS